MLAKSESSSQRFYSLSSQIQIERQAYYSILESTQKGDLDITPWVKWFIECLGRAIERSQKELNSVLNKARFWESLSNISINGCQRRIINLILDDLFYGSLTSSKWAKMTKCLQDAAYRDILQLINLGVLTKNPEGGRSTSYPLTIASKQLSQTNDN